LPLFSFTSVFGPVVLSNTVLQDPAPVPLHIKSWNEVRISGPCPAPRFSSTPIENVRGIVKGAESVEPATYTGEKKLQRPPAQGPELLV